jgi:hypothetical protein
VAKATRAAVNLHCDIAWVDTQANGNPLVVDFGDSVYLDKVVSSAQRPELIPPTFTSAV